LLRLLWRLLPALLCRQHQQLLLQRLQGQLFPCLLLLLLGLRAQAPGQVDVFWRRRRHLWRAGSQGRQAPLLVHWPPRPRRPLLLLLLRRRRRRRRVWQALLCRSKRHLLLCSLILWQIKPAVINRALVFMLPRAQLLLLRLLLLRLIKLLQLRWRQLRLLALLLLLQRLWLLLLLCLRLLLLRLLVRLLHLLRLLLPLLLLPLVLQLLGLLSGQFVLVAHVALEQRHLVRWPLASEGPEEDSSHLKCHWRRHSIACSSDRTRWSTRRGAAGASIRKNTWFAVWLAGLADQ
jgi:hypothetical protein